MKKIWIITLCALVLTSCGGPAIKLAEDEERVGTIENDIYYGEFFEMPMPGEGWFVQHREEGYTALWPPEYDDIASIEIFINDDEIAFEWLAPEYLEQQTIVDYENMGIEEVSVEVGEPEEFEHDGTEGRKIVYDMVLDDLEMTTYQWIYSYTGGHLTINASEDGEEYKEVYEEITNALNFYN